MNSKPRDYTIHMKDVKGTTRQGGDLVAGHKIRVADTTTGRIVIRFTGTAYSRIFGRSVRWSRIWGSILRQWGRRGGGGNEIRVSQAIGEHVLVRHSAGKAEPPELQPFHKDHKVQDVGEKEAQAEEEQDHERDSRWRAEALLALLLSEPQEGQAQRHDNPSHKRPIYARLADLQVYFPLGAAEKSGRAIDERAAMAAEAECVKHAEDGTTNQHRTPLDDGANEGPGDEHEPRKGVEVIDAGARLRIEIQCRAEAVSERKDEGRDANPHERQHEEVVHDLARTCLEEDLHHKPEAGRIKRVLRTERG